LGNTKQRAIPFVWPRTFWSYTEGATGWPTPNQITGGYPAEVAPNLQGRQVTASESHPAWRSRKRNSGGDIGGSFSSERTIATLSGGTGVVPFSGDIGGMTRKGYYRGCCRPDTGIVGFPSNSPSSDSALKSWGTTAIARVKPTNVFVDLSSSLAEIVREGIPKLGVHAWESITDAAREAADHHLSISFGFQPVVSDIYKTLGSHVAAGTKIDQYLKDVGKPVRRRFDLGAQASTETIVWKNIAFPRLGLSHSQIDALWEPYGKTILTRTTSRHRWFSGACTYGLPLDDSMREMSVEAVRRQGLINLDITPETLWNLAPWSWAVDWFLPVGDLISNLQDQQSNGLVWTYAYVMEHSFCSDTYTHVGPGSDKVGSLTLTTESKKRIPAGPFGFGIDWNGLSPFQQSIVAALGMSRSK
jgi:hypothetical protein